MTEAVKAIQKKVCLLGSFGVGKTSLVRRFVQGIFDERYLTTLGVKIDKKEFTLPDKKAMINLVLWDLAGEDFRAPVQLAYVRGAAACLYVADVTRPETLTTAQTIAARVREQVGPLPFALALNKTDLTAGDPAYGDQKRDATSGILTQMTTEGWTVTQTSAKTGAGVEDAFAALALRLL